MGAKPLRIRFDKIDGFIKIYDGTRQLVLFSPERYDPIYDRIRYLVSEKMILHTVLTELVHIILYLQKKH